MTTLYEYLNMAHHYAMIIGGFALVITFLLSSFFTMGWIIYSIIKKLVSSDNGSIAARSYL